MQNWRGGARPPRQQPIREEAPLPGVIDTIGLGYAALWLRPQLLVPPILIDLYLWLGLRVTAKPVTLRLLEWSRGKGNAIETLARDAHARGDFNVLEWLSLRLPTLRMPGLIPLFANREPAPPRSWLVVDRVVPFASMRASYVIVKRYFWQSIGFIAISLTISTGFPYALRALTDRPVGLAIAIAVNAFVASGMLAAGMLFYRDRARRL